MKGGTIASFALGLVGVALNASAANKAFPQHVTYAAGIKPSNVSQASMDSTVSSFWTAYSSRYIKSASTGGYYIAANIEGQIDSGASTVSEAHGYGMVLCAYMGDKTHFDGMYTYYKNHPSDNNALLMAWEQNGSFNDINGADSATDGDMDIAYSLLIADKQWGSTGTINYLQAAKNMINAIMQSDVNQTQWTLRLGDWATSGTSQGFSESTATRPSDFMFDHMKAFQVATGDTRWTNVINKTNTVINSLFSSKSPNTGLIPDFVVLNGSTYQPAPANFLEASTDGEYAYNSCRTPWRFATDYLLTGSSGILSEMRKMNSWIQSSSGSNPDKVYPGYSLSGTALDKSYTDDSFTSPFALCSMIDSGNQSWLNTTWSWIAARGINTDDGYFGNSITMQCVIVMSGNWWSPSTTGGGGTGGFSGNYKILDRNSGKAVVVQGASLVNSAACILYTFNASGNDEWTAIQLADGHYEFQNVHSALAMVVQSASTATGAAVIQYAFGGANTNDEWDIHDLGTGYYEITNVNSGLALDVKSAGTANGTVIDQNTYSGATNQQFQLISLP